MVVQMPLVASLAAIFVNSPFNQSPVANRCRLGSVKASLSRYPKFSAVQEHCPSKNHSPFAIRHSLSLLARQKPRPPTTSVMG